MYRARATEMIISQCARYLVKIAHVGAICGRERDRLGGDLIGAPCVHPLPRSVPHLRFHLSPISPPMCVFLKFPAQPVCVG